MTDESLMSSFQKGSEEGFERLYEKFAPKVYGFIFKRLRESDATRLNLLVWRKLFDERVNYKGQEFLPWFFSLMEQPIAEKVASVGRTHERVESPNEPIDYASFLNTADAPPEDIFLYVKNDILFAFRKKQIYLKFFLFFFAGALAPLSFGLKQYTLVVCALFGWGIVLIGMKWDEIRWVLRRLR